MIIQNSKTNYYLSILHSKAGPIWGKYLNQAMRFLTMEKINEAKNISKLNGPIYLSDPDDHWAVLHKN